jgi:hypothetical protein
LIIGAGLASLVGCGESSTVASIPTPTPVAVSGITVTLAQPTTAFDASQSDAITATVHNDPSNKGVLWTVSCTTGVACGNMASASSASGVADTYAAPSSLTAAIRVQIQAASAADHSKIAVVQLTVNPPPTLVSPPPAQPAAGVVGQNFSVDLMQYVQGGTKPYTWSLKSGGLPTGLTLEPSGTIDGKPTAAIVATPVTFAVTDSGNPPIIAKVSILLTINLPVALVITNGVPPNGTVGAPYNLHRACPFCGYRSGFSLIASGGVQPYTWSWTAAAGSSLPPGLGLSPTGLINGIPTMAGTYTFVVTVTDSALPSNQVSATYTITVS